MTPHSRALLWVLLATAGLAFKGIFVRFAYELGMTVAAVLVWRIALATPLYWGLVYKSPKPFERQWRVWLKAIVCGHLFTLATVCDFQALSMMDVGVSRAILFTFPLFVQILAIVHQKRRPSRREVSAFLICYSGLLLMLDIGAGGALNVPWHGVMYSLVAAGSYGGFLYYGKRLSQQLGSVQFTAWANTSSLIWVLLYLLLWAQPADAVLNVEAFGWLLMLVVFATVAPFVLLFDGMTQLGAEQSSMLTMLGPVITLLAAALLLNESLSLLQVLGFALVLAGMAHLQNLWPERLWVRSRG